MVSSVVEVSSHTPWVSVNEDKWEEEEQCGNEDQAEFERRFKEASKISRPPTIDLTEEQGEEIDRVELAFEEKLEPEVAKVIEVIDLTTGNVRRRPRKVTSPPKRNSSISLPDRCLDSYSYNGLELKPGGAIEMIPIPHLRHASFLLIQLIIHTESGVILRGLPLTRTRNLRGQLPRLRNEVALVLEIDRDDLRPYREQAAIEIPLRAIIKHRVCLITNKPFPEHRFASKIYESIQDVEDRGVLICRWKVRYVWGDAAKRCNKKPPNEFSISRMISEEVHKERYRTSDSYLMNAWRGGKVRGGSYIPDEPDSSRLMVNVDDSENQDDTKGDDWIPRKPGQQYTFADMFCGAGGASCGAKKAGLRIMLSVDNAQGACNTYRMMYPEADLRQQDMYDFIIEMRHSHLHVDVLHLSPPCQYWSPAHTTPGVDDDANIAILFACHELVKILRPRVFTVEQTFGILHPRFEYYFNSLIQGFTRHDYSISWKVVNLLTWGAPSQRNRLIMIGACIGEGLPPFPVQTHSEEPVEGDGTKPYRTVQQMLQTIPRSARRDDELHSPDKMKRYLRPRWDPKVPLLRTITCSGGVGNYHYTGLRDFTLREYAVLQGFPPDYDFRKPSQKRQIGNAFPPLVVKQLYKHLRRWLEQKDRVHADNGELSGSEDEEYKTDSDAANRELESDDDDLQYLGERGIDRQLSLSEVEFLGGRKLTQQASILTINSESEDGMEIDAMSQDVLSPSTCIDVAQTKGGGRDSPIELD
ncbi:S-adenosyl-L-methionine-dependent methyltransferase [Annulohypoxylon maeteangense]|uniref:S-adenosyl-L-methionine-dependent methyltransferase n=1 Tax=Annulohypoxylon maeteangense TaxID=1927788 RepID=UPI0020072654|nr:S-adenosyl-L-methionine-dependent methyltransferase [Annulohypoxylon maeteangense]KAI0888516.1 S-adenosyl-L-methionine-dependent methyltransferase [Annulohypoxylon maeteangense]